VVRRGNKQPQPSELFRDSEPFEGRVIIAGLRLIPLKRNTVALQQIETPNKTGQIAFIGV
jgi:hypothetical protein